MMHEVVVYGSIWEASLGACLLLQEAPWWPEGMPSVPGRAWLPQGRAGCCQQDSRGSSPIAAALQQLLWHGCSHWQKDPHGRYCPVPVQNMYLPVESGLRIAFTAAHFTEGVLATGQSLYRGTEASRWHSPLNSFQSAHDFAANAFCAH